MVRMDSAYYTAAVIARNHLRKPIVEEDAVQNSVGGLRLSGIASRHARDTVLA